MELKRTPLSMKQLKQMDAWSEVDFNDLSEEERENYQKFFKYGLCDTFTSVSSLLAFYPEFETKTSKTSRFCYLDKNGNIVGLAVVEFCHDYGFSDNYLCLHHLIINPSVLHKGIGTYILNDLINNSFELSKFNCQELYLCTSKRNEPMHNLLKKFGFEEIVDENNDDSFDLFKCPTKGKENEIR